MCQFHILVDRYPRRGEFAEHFRGALNNKGTAHDFHPRPFPIREFRCYVHDLLPKVSDCTEKFTGKIRIDAIATSPYRHEIVELLL